MAKRISLGRTQQLMENLKRELKMGGTTLTNITQQGTSTSTAGTGAVSGSTTAPATRVTTVNGEIITTITVNLTNLSASGETGIIIGNKEAAADGTAPAYLIQWDTATNGICYKVELSCIETITGNGGFADDIDLETDDAELEMGGDPSTNNNVILASAASIVAGDTISNLTPGSLNNDQFLYMVNGDAPGGTGDAQYATGKLVVRLYGHADF